MESTVSFCVGGQFFTTNRDTLNKEPSCRLSLIARGTIPVIQDAQGVFFIDRDPKYFQLLLNFLRDGWCCLPASENERTELLHEIRFYQFGEMEIWVRSQELLSSHPYSSIKPMSPKSSGPTLAYTGSPGRRVLYTVPEPLLVGINNTPGLRGAASNAASWSANFESPKLQKTPIANPASPSTRPGMQHPIRAVFMEATAAGPSPVYNPPYSIPQLEEGNSKWTAKYIKSNDGLREVANTLLELGFIAPHRLLHAGKVVLRISSECRHDRMASLLTSSHGDGSRTRPEIVSVKSSAGWGFELNLRPGSSEPELLDKYNIAEFVHDNWFVLCATLKDQFGVLMEEDSAVRPTCTACRRVHLAVTLNKIF